MIFDPRWIIFPNPTVGYVCSMGDELPWDEIERYYNFRLNNRVSIQNWRLDKILP